MEKVLAIDNSVFNYIQSHCVHINKWLDYIWIGLGVWLIYLIPIILLAGWFWSAQTKRVMFKAFLAGVLAWQVISKIIAGISHRSRPQLSLVGAQELAFHRSDFSFPSDHASFVFAIAVMVRLLGHRKLGNFLLLVSFLVIVGRVMIGVHYPLDVIAGALIGVFCALLVFILQKIVDRFLTEPIVKMFAKVHL